MKSSDLGGAGGSAGDRLRFLAGMVAQVFYDRSELGPADLSGDAWDPDDSVQLILHSMPTEEHYRIWDTAKMSYRLSLTYLARGVGIEPGVAIRHAPVVQADFGVGARRP